LEPGELERFEAVVLPHLDAAYGLARYLVRDDADAEDVVQESFLRALRHFSGYRGEGASHGRAWVLAIVRNMAHTWRHRRRAESHATAFDESVHSDAARDAGVAAAEPADLALERSDRRETLAQALERLPAELRETIVLREIEELSYKEIGEVMEVPIGTVMSRLSRGRKRLQAALTASREGL
jgi:RNA polymerase sigma factor (sigma-70 family)